MENTEEQKEKYARINIKLKTNVHKALQYARIELSAGTEEIVEEAIKAHLLKLGFLKETGEVNKPEAIPISNTSNLEE